MRAGEVQVDHAQTHAEPTTDLEEAQAQGSELEVGHLAPRQPAAQGIEEPVGGAVQQQADLIGLSVRMKGAGAADS